MLDGPMNAYAFVTYVTLVLVPEWTCPAKVERHLLNVPRFARIARG